MAGLQPGQESAGAQELATGKPAEPAGWKARPTGQKPPGLRPQFLYILGVDFIRRRCEDGRVKRRGWTYWSRSGGARKRSGLVVPRSACSAGSEPDWPTGSQRDPVHQPQVKPVSGRIRQRGARSQEGSASPGVGCKPRCCGRGRPHSGTGSKPVKPSQTGSKSLRGVSRVQFSVFWKSNAFAQVVAVQRAVRRPLGFVRLCQTLQFKKYLNTDEHR
jgi:hypothetical protein